MAAISHKMTRPSEQFDNFIKQRNFFVTSIVTKSKQFFVMFFIWNWELIHRVEHHKLERDKQLTLFCPTVIDEWKKFYNLDPR